MTRQWSDGAHDDSTREFELRQEFEQSCRLGGQISDLRAQNDWLRHQVQFGPWRIENYQGAVDKRKHRAKAAGA